MKKTLLIVAVIVAVLVCAGGFAGYLVFDSVMPKAEPLDCPAPDNVTSVTVLLNGGEAVDLDVADFSEVMAFIASSRPTRKMSVNDYPAAMSFYSVVIASTQREYRFFVYEEDGCVYLELPYEGIYRSDRAFFDLLSSYYSL